MRHHRDAARDEEADRAGHALAALQLDRRAAGRRHQPGGAAERLLAALLIGAERQVDDHQRPFEAATNRLPVQDHHVEGDAERRRHAVEDHADAVADQDDVAMAVDEPRHRRGVGGEADQRRAAFAGRHVRRGDGFPFTCRAHCP